ncbi:MAG: hypothetical protein RL701_4490 [Pseudomonadota bacterium]
MPDVVSAESVLVTACTSGTFWCSKPETQKVCSCTARKRNYAKLIAY